jgi:hypothetical protein
MTQSEAAEALGLTKGAISQLVKRGMPLHSLEAIQEWREKNAPPRKALPQKSVQPKSERQQPKLPPKLPKAPAESPPPPASAIPTPEPAPVQPLQPPSPPPVPDPVIDNKESDPRDSVRMARLAEKAAWARFAAAQKNPHTSPDEFRRINAAYIAARQNRMKAEQDFRDWRKAEGITLFLSEAQEICARPHQAAAHMLTTMPKQIAPRLVNQPIREIERTLADWCDGLAAVIREAI